MEALDRWREAQPATFWDDGSPFAARLDPAALDRVRAFGETVVQEVDPEVYAAEVDGPQVHAGTRIEFNPAYHRAGSAVWASGVIDAGAWEQSAMLYLLTHAGEAGHACPVVCTAGLIRALRREASDELRERFLPPLLEPDYALCHRGSQFLTEIQGGSDVGANTTEAVPDGDVWRLHGEKWFCSVADADQFVVTARPRGAAPGTRGIGCFLVPRLVDGEPNGFTIERLKDKVGTRALATGEFTFHGALAYPIGALEDGFRIAAGVVLNTSRWLNAFGSAGLMRRAYIVAESFSRYREAFGRPLAEHPLVHENLAVMGAEVSAALASSLEVTALVERIDAGTASDDDVAWFRILVNANKLVTSLAATAVCRRGIEALGGNGTIEDFSPMPRLWRDAIVFESWEGTHNVLVAQVLRDVGRFGVELVHERVGEIDELQRAVEEPGSADGRRAVEGIVRTLQVTRLLEVGDDESARQIARRSAGEEPA